MVARVLKLIDEEEDLEAGQLVEVLGLNFESLVSDPFVLDLRLGLDFLNLPSN
jgi:hypothetical protein